MSLSGTIDRRDFLMLSAATVVATGARRAFATGSAPGSKEAPELASLVKAGKLPALADRLPEQPLVVETIESVGQYGGQLRRALRGDADHNSLLRIVGNQGLTRWSPDFSTVLPNVAESWEINPEATEYTFKLRKGMKWSDGHPLTADDLVFWVDDLLHDNDFYPARPEAYVINGKPLNIEKIDDLTVKYIFSGSYGHFNEQLATPLGQHPVLYAKHYCQQFHPKYNPDIAVLLKQYNMTSWTDLFRLKCGDIETPARWANLDRPTLDPWLVETPYGGGVTAVTMRRNPFFWQVDSQGQQLPYVDKIQNNVISDIETIILSAVKGDLDLQMRHIYDIGNKPVFVQHMKEGHYVLQELVSTDTNMMGFFFNQTHKDPAMRRLMRDKEFRIGLSHALNRPEMIEIVWLGQSKPWQVGPLPQHRLYNEQLGTQYLEYDVDKANSILDKAGYDKRDGSNFRLMPDGTKIFLNVDVMLPHKEIIDALELVKGYWADVGIDMNINTLERSIFYNRAQTNDYTIGMYPLPGGLDPELEPRVYVAVHQLDSRQSIEWAKWYASHGKLGEEPTPSMKKRMELLDEWKTVADEAKADAIFKQILQMAADAFEVMAVTMPPHLFGVKNQHLKNVIAPMTQSWSYATPGPALPQQFFYDNI